MCSHRPGPFPREWLEVAARQVLCLASGGQQALILAAAGATVSVLDNSPKQLDRGAKMAERHGRGGDSDVLNKYMPMFIATRALKVG